MLTPHPLEAARLLGFNVAQVQASRLTAASQLAERFQCVVVLKGSGTVITGPGRVPAINSTGNALLATAGTGDALAGMVGAGIARSVQAADNDFNAVVEAVFEAVCAAVFIHGLMADSWALNKPGQTLTASLLATLQ